MEKMTARLGAVLYVCWGLLHFTAAYGVYKLAQNSPANMAQGRLMQTAFYLATFAAIRDRARTHAELAQRPQRPLGQRGDGRHCRHSFHSVRLDPRIRTVVAGPAWSGALDCGLFTHGPRADGRHDALASHKVAGRRPPMLVELHTPKRNQRPWFRNRPPTGEEGCDVVLAARTASDAPHPSRFIRHRLPDVDQH